MVVQLLGFNKRRCDSGSRGNHGPQKPEDCFLIRRVDRFTKVGVKSTGGVARNPLHPLTLNPKPPSPKEEIPHILSLSGFRASTQF